MGQGSNPSMSYGAVRGPKEEKEDILQAPPPESSHLVVDGVAEFPDGGYGWVICFTCFFCAIVVDGIPTGIFTRSHHFRIKTSKFVQISIEKEKMQYINPIQCPLNIAILDITTMTVMTSNFGKNSDHFKTTLH